MKRALWLVLLLSHVVVAQKQVSYLATDSGRYAAQVLEASLSSPASRRIPFQLKNGMILLPASLDGEQGMVILDTGAPQFVVNRSEGNGTAQVANSCNGSFEVNLVRVGRFQWSGGEFQDLEAIALDLSHLERTLRRRLLGIVGYSLIKDFELLIDYRQGHMMLFNPGSDLLHRAANPSATLPFLLEDHLPVLTLKVGSKTLRFGLDTGAEGNLIDRQVLPPGGFRTIRLEELRGLDQSTQQVAVVEIPELSLGAAPLADQPFLVTSFQHLRQTDGKSIDGLLGYPFLHNSIVSINFAKQKIHFWKE